MKGLKITLISCCLCLFLLACGKQCVHEYQSKITKNPSCTEQGVETMICTLCKHSYTRSVPTLEHVFEIHEIEKNATCTEEGSQKVVCTLCDEKKSEKIKKVPHTLENGVVITPSTCSKEGRQKGDCTVCDAKQVIEKIPVNGTHTFSEKIVRAATCKEAGEGVKTCTNCKYSESCYYEPRPHTYTSEKILKQATCSQKGSKQFTCIQCDKIITESTDALGHVWIGETCTKAGVCYVCKAVGTTSEHEYKIIREYDYNSAFAGQRVKECETCGKKKTEYITAQGEVDMDLATEEVVSYARGRGFKVSVGTVNQHESYRYIEAYRLNWPSGSTDPNFAQNQIVEMGKKEVDRLYQSYSASAAGISAYTLHINSYYNTNAGFGMGWFIFYFDVI